MICNATIPNLKPFFGIFFFSLLAVFSPLFAQFPDLEWHHLFEPIDNGFVQGADLVESSDGNIVVLHRFQGDCDFDPGPGTDTLSNASFSMVVQKLDKAGNHLWARVVTTAGSNSVLGNAIQTDAWGNIYCVGHFNGTVDFDPGPGTQSFTSAGDFDAFLLKLDANGNFLRVSLFQGSGAQFGQFLYLDAGGNSYFGGQFRSSFDMDPGPGTDIRSSVGQTDVYVLSLDSSGALRWGQTVGGPNVDFPTGITGDSLGNLYLTLSLSAGVDVDPGPGVDTLGGAPRGVTLWHLDANGQYQWAKRIHGNGSNWYGFIPAADPFGNIYLLGAFSDSLDLDPGPDSAWVIGQGPGPVAFAKYDRNGNYLWGGAFDGTGISEPYDIQTDFRGNVYLSVFHGYGSLDYEIGPGVTSLNPSGDENTGLVKYDSSGNLIWLAPLLSDTVNDYAYGKAILVARDDQFYATGSIEGTVDFDPGPSVVLDSAVTAGHLLKFGQCYTSFATLQPQSCAPYLSPGGTLLTMSGLYQDTIVNQGGCDSIISIQLTMESLDPGLINSGDTLFAVQDSADYQWVDCDSGFSPVPGATSQSFIPTLTGNYAVVVNYLGCTDTSACESVVLASRALPVSGFSLIAFPNPIHKDLGQSTVKLELSQPLPGGELRLSDALGKLWFRKELGTDQVLELDLKSLPAGVYWLGLTGKNDESKGTTKLVVVQ